MRLQMAPSEITQKGEQIYKEKLKPDFEIKYPGKYVAIEVKSGKYFMDDYLIDALQKARKKFPNEVFYSVRVGSPTIYNSASGTVVGTVSSQ